MEQREKVLVGILSLLKGCSCKAICKEMGLRLGEEFQ